MFGNHISMLPLRIIALFAILPVMACSPSQQAEQDPQASGVGNEPVNTRSAGSTMHAADSAPFAILTPEMWEARIARMVEEGNIEEADAELLKLNREFPGYTVNPSLLENLNRNHE
jgi:hypothetical protein